VNGGLSVEKRKDIKGYNPEGERMEVMKKRMATFWTRELILILSAANPT
jgi:hypothetical protein